MALYEEDDSDRLRTEILLNIGELKDSTSVDFLIDILDDDYIDKTSRQYACYSLGLIADDKSYPALLKAYEDTDPSLRSYALDALSKFSKDDTEGNNAAGIKRRQLADKKAGCFICCGT